mmetsp:Transcript_44083/g.140350  ORF Transcript_44083/g.140350 Transcript_44083/m.140350 type:complete len:115 (-) Transcript_44083:141-485(-)
MSEAAATAGQIVAGGGSGGREGEKERSPKASKAATLLNRRMKIGIKDGRTLVGNFNCIDKQGNIVLINTLECGGGEGDGGSPQRTLGLVLVPASHRVSCHVESTVAEELQLLSL